MKISHNIFLIIFLFSLIAQSCSEKEKEISLVLSDAGDISIPHEFKNDIDYIGELSVAAFDRLIQPSEYINRFVIQDFSDNTYYQVYDIHLNGEIRIRGNGRYDFYKSGKYPNTWFLKIDRSTIQEIKINGGTAKPLSLLARFLIFVGVMFAAIGIGTVAAGGIGIIPLLIGIILILIGINA